MKPVFRLLMQHSIDWYVARWERGRDSYALWRSHCSFWLPGRQPQRSARYALSLHIAICSATQDYCRGVFAVSCAPHRKQIP